MNANAANTRGPAAAGNGQSSVGALTAEIKDALRKKVAQGIVAGFVAALVLVGGIIWAAGELWVRTQVIDIVVNDFTAENSLLSGEVRRLVASELEAPQSDIGEAFQGRVSQALDEAFSSRVGAVSAGRFSLDAAGPTQMVFVYLPPEQEAQLYVRARGLSAGEIIRLVSTGPSNPNIDPILHDGVWRFDVQDLKKAGDDPQSIAIRSVTADLVQGHMQHLVPISFHLTRNGGRGELSSRVDLEFLTLIWPPITASKM
jgi:hypothetical protein